MKKKGVRGFLPENIAKVLWGDRKRWGLTIKQDDHCWKEWQQLYITFYQGNQRGGIGTKVNDAGYRVMSNVDMKDKVVLEVGPGDIRHIPYWRDKPSHYILADIQEEMLTKAMDKLKKNGTSVQCMHMQREQKLPINDNSVDVAVSFFSLEHIYPLGPYLNELKRILNEEFGWYKKDSAMNKNNDSQPADQIFKVDFEENRINRKKDSVPDQKFQIEWEEDTTQNG